MHDSTRMMYGRMTFIVSGIDNMTIYLFVREIVQFFDDVPYHFLIGSRTGG